MNGRQFLESISFELGKNSALGILGKSGAGKSLLAKSLIRLVDKRFILRADELSIANFAPLKLNAKDLRNLRSKVGEFSPYV